MPFNNNSNSCNEKESTTMAPTKHRNPANSLSRLNDTLQAKNDNDEDDDKSAERKAAPKRTTRMTTTRRMITKTLVPFVLVVWRMVIVSGCCPAITSFTSIVSRRGFLAETLVPSAAQPRRHHNTTTITTTIATAMMTATPTKSKEPTTEQNDRPDKLRLHGWLHPCLH